MIRKIYNSIAKIKPTLLFHLFVSLFDTFRKTKYDDRIYRNSIFLSKKVGNKTAFNQMTKKIKFWSDNIDAGTWASFYETETWLLKLENLAHLSLSKNLEFSKTHYYSIKEISSRFEESIEEGKNYYTLKWINYYPYVAITILSEGMRPMSIDLFKLYDRWSKEFNPWTVAITGSYHSSVSGSIALHHMLKYLFAQDDDVKIDSLKKYNKYLKKYIKHIEKAFDVHNGFSSPHSGIQMATKELEIASILGILQRRLNIFSVLEMPEISNFIGYIDLSITTDGDYHPSNYSDGVNISPHILLAYHLISQNKEEKAFLSDITDSFIYPEDVFLPALFNYKTHELQHNKIS